jgi:3-oxoacyl-[acyl-carrier protein] reductase
MNGNDAPRAPAPAARETILVLGASSDIGAELLRRLAGEQPLVLAHFNASADKLERLRHELPGLTLVPLPADLSRPGEIESLVTTVRNEHPEPDKIVHLAAPKLEYVRFKDLSWEHFQQGMDVQLRSFVAVLQAFLPPMARRKRGKIVAVLSSVTFGLPPTALAHYVTTKYALLGLVRALAAEYASRHVNINAVSPSTVETAFLERLPPRLVEITAAQHPRQRHATAADVAAAVCFLLSPGAAYVSGANLPVTGGATF